MRFARHFSSRLLSVSRCAPRARAPPQAQQRDRFSDRSAACGGRASGYLLIAIAVVIYCGGCRSLQRQGPLPKSVATSRHLQQQGVARWNAANGNGPKNC